MTSLALHMFGAADIEGFGLWMFLSVGAVALFVIFLPATSWIDARRREREAYYKAETIRRLAESSSDGAKAAVDMLREQSRQERIKRREGMKIGGLINLGVGLALMIFLRVLVANEAVYLCGLIPGFIGLAMLIYVLFLAAPIE